MAKYPISVLQGKIAECFDQILQLHVPKNGLILDPTCGQKHLWKGLDTANVTFSDVVPYPESCQVNLFNILQERPDWAKKFDVIVFDPPYMFGVKCSSDPRVKDYGGYAQTYDDLLRYMELTRTVLPKLLKPQGVLILKCADQYYVPEKKLYLHHFDWVMKMRDFFDIVDFYVYRHHRMSPTAFQVKNRGANVIMHTYFIVGKKKD